MEQKLLDVPSIGPVDASSDRISEGALEDITDWLGFDHEFKYLVALEDEGHKVLERATY